MCNPLWPCLVVRRKGGNASLSDRSSSSLFGFTRPFVCSRNHSRPLYVPWYHCPCLQDSDLYLGFKLLLVDSGHNDLVFHGSSLYRPIPTLYVHTSRWTQEDTVHFPRRELGCLSPVGLVNKRFLGFVTFRSETSFPINWVWMINNCPQRM